MEREEILFDVAFGNEKGKGELSRQRSGNWDVYVNNRAYGSIINYDGGWMVMLRGDEFKQGDADELLSIAGISLEEKYPVDGYVERKPAYKIKDAHKTMWPDCPIYGKDKSPG